MKFSTLPGIYYCHYIGGNQEWSISKEGEIKHQDLCLTLEKLVSGSKVLMKFCDESDNQQWKLNENGIIQLQYKSLNICLDSRYGREEQRLTAELCNSVFETQHWQFVTKLS